MDVCVRHFQSQHGHAHLLAGNSLLYGLGDTLGEYVQCCKFVVGEIEYVVDLMLGNHQHVALGHGVDVEKGIVALVLGHTIRGYLAGGYA